MSNTSERHNFISEKHPCKRSIAKGHRLLRQTTLLLYSTAYVSATDTKLPLLLNKPKKKKTVGEEKDGGRELVRCSGFE